MNQNGVNSLAEGGINPCGNSMYNAVIKALEALKARDPSLFARLEGKTLNEQMMQLRKLVRERLEHKINNKGHDNSEWYDTFISKIKPTGSQDSDYIIIMNYLRNIETLGNDGDHIVLEILAEIFGIQIKLYDGDAKAEFGKEDNPIEIYLHLNEESHYDFSEFPPTAEVLPLTAEAALAAVIPLPVEEIPAPVMMLPPAAGLAVVSEAFPSTTEEVPASVVLLQSRFQAAKMVQLITEAIPASVVMLPSAAGPAVVSEGPPLTTEAVPAAMPPLTAAMLPPNNSVVNIKVWLSGIISSAIPDSDLQD
jgi:hypothetical protein